MTYLTIVTRFENRKKSNSKIILNDDNLKKIKGEILRKFKTLSEAKKQAKDISTKYKNHLIEYHNKFGHCKKQTIKKSNFFFKMTESDCLLKLNEGGDYFFYSNNENFSNCSGSGGKGFYVRLKTKCGSIDYKIFND